MRLTGRGPRWALVAAGVAVAAPIVAKPGALLAIRAYQRHWRWRRGRCWHRPTCSQYGYEAVARYGFRAGIVKAADRISRCSAAELEKYRASLPSPGDRVRRDDPCR